MKSNFQIHIPKTGGTSIREALNVYRKTYKRSHETPAYLAENLHGFHELEVVYGFIRDPWARALSWYLYGPPHQKFPTFESWVLHGCDVMWTEKRGGARMLFQEDWLFIDGKLALNFIGRFERLHTDFARLCEVLGVEPVKLGQHRVVDKRRHPHCDYPDYNQDYTPYYTDEMRKVVDPMFREFAAQFGYRFGRR